MKLASAAGVTTDELLGVAKEVAPIGTMVPIKGRIGASARLYLEAGLGKVAVPWVFGGKLDAAVIDGDAMSPIRSGWVVVFESDECEPQLAIGKLAVVRVAGRSHKIVREIILGSQRDLYTLIGWACAPMQDVELDSVQLVVSIMQNFDTPVAATGASD